MRQMKDHNSNETACEESLAVFLYVLHSSYTYGGTHEADSKLKG
jgi:hypothetical protein